jgi:hypothetical protein
VGAGAGVGVELWREHSPPAATHHASAALVDALNTEHELIAGVDASVPGAGKAAATLRHIRSDHRAHARALAAAIREAGGAAPRADPTGATAATHSRQPPSQPVTQLAHAEAAASRRAAARAANMHGGDAALLASIAASEATHAELLR